VFVTIDNLQTDTDICKENNRPSGLHVLKGTNKPDKEKTRHHQPPEIVVIQHVELGHGLPRPRTSRTGIGSGERHEAESTNGSGPILCLEEVGNRWRATSEKVRSAAGGWKSWQSVSVGGVGAHFSVPAFEAEWPWQGHFELNFNKTCNFKVCS
jgi:hypothetical protein